MSRAIDTMMARYQPVVEECCFDLWKITARKSHILASEGPERQNFEAEVRLPHVPDMIFAENCLHLQHETGFGIEFTSLEALKRVDAERDLVHVAGAREWKEARAECEHVENVIHPFDWTFSTDYCGTLTGPDNIRLVPEPTDEQIDVERLKVRNKISFYTEVVLFEDELHDSGCSVLSAKIRVMPDFFLVLLRFYLRVDNVLIRVNDTRYFYQSGADHVLREYTSRESPVSELDMVPLSVLNDPVEIIEHLKIKTRCLEKLKFPANSIESSHGALTAAP